MGETILVLGETILVLGENILVLGKTILVLGETMWAKLVMGETRYNRSSCNYMYPSLRPLSYHTLFISCYRLGNLRQLAIFSSLTSIQDSVSDQVTEISVLNIERGLKDEVSQGIWPQSIEYFFV